MDDGRGSDARADVGGQPLLFGYREIPRTLARKHRDAMPDAGIEPRHSSRIEPPEEPTRFTLAEINARLEAAGDDTLTMEEIAQGAARDCNDQ